MRSCIKNCGNIWYEFLTKLEIGCFFGNILATENQQAIINDVIEVKKACICIKFKQI